MDFHVYPEGCVFNSIEDIAGKKITVMGLGLNGGGEACVKFFLQHGAYVTVTDMKTAEQLAPTLKSIAQDERLDKSRITYVLGQHRIEDFENADCVIKNPGVKIQGNQYLAKAKAIETDLSIFLHFTKAPIIAVTGSKGKSSTVSAIYNGLLGAGFQAYLGGNITVSPLTFLDKTDGTTPVVLELSSWQLADLRGRKALKPKISIITRIVPDHQNWYGDMDSYIADKTLIFADQDENDFTIVSADDDGYLKETAIPEIGCKSWGDYFASMTKAKVLRYSSNVLQHDLFGAFLMRDGDEVCGYARLPQELMSKSSTASNIQEEKILGKLLVPGPHMKINALNASLVLRLMNVAPEQCISILSEWKGVPHRLEHFYDAVVPFNNIKLAFYNDTCATVPEACAAAVQSFDDGVVLICGGTDKNLDFTPLIQTLSGNNGKRFIPRKILLLEGTGTDKLIPLLEEENIPYNGPYNSLGALLGILKTELIQEDAVKTFGYTEDGGAIPVVFSPGATSFGLFSNEFERGNSFKKEVLSLFEQTH
ncbi:MAG: UDP-N-acetylmuramoyl-L-alanine--D-glutamate ligase [Treponema sp.]|nr:UDP-N-acetylmuramoyl-L-alanine--D-glutamate ligase [Treponema sp.]